MVVESVLKSVLNMYGLLLTMVVLCCIGCACMKFSDLRLKYYVMETAKKKGVNIDLEKLDPKPTSYQSSDLNENCTIMVPDIGIIL